MLPSGEQLPAAEILDAEWSEAAPTPLSEELIRAIVEQMPMRSQEAIRSDRPPSLSGYQWQRADGEGWNLWQVLYDGPDKKHTRYVGQLPYDQWQQIQSAYYTPRNPVQPDLAGDPGDRGPDAPGPASGGEQPRRRDREHQARPTPAGKNVVPIDSRRTPAKAERKQIQPPAGSAEAPPTLAGYKREASGSGWVYWRQVLTPTEKRDARGRIQYRRTKSYGVRIGKRTWNILRRYDNGTIITIISGRIAGRAEHRDSAGQRSAAAM